jgi:hypothetical protein
MLGVSISRGGSVVLSRIAAVWSRCRSAVADFVREQDRQRAAEHRSDLEHRVRRELELIWALPASTAAGSDRIRATDDV